MDYDRDGSVVLRIQNSVVYDELDTNERQILNNENAGDSYFMANSAGGTHHRHLIILFPELRDLVGYLAHATYSFGGSLGALQVSSDTTNGIDGTWTTVLTNFASTGSSKTAMRTGIQSLNRTNVKGVRFTIGITDPNTGAYFYTIHLYGQPSAGQAPDRLRIWHPTLDQEVGGAYFDWADVARSTSHARQFRVKNSSGTYQANNVTLSTNILTNSTPSLGNQITYDMGGGPAASLNIGSLSPGQISSVITASLNVDPAMSLGLWSARTLLSVA